MPWAMSEPRTVDETRAHLLRGAARFVAGQDFQYSVFDSDEKEILGGAGLHARSEPGCFEIGYWIRANQVNQGFATECARALTIAALETSGVERVEIDCDPANVASRRVPEKLGYQLLERREGNKRTPLGEPRDTLVFQISRLADLASSLCLRPM